jgi:hypothetical protein
MLLLSSSLLSVTKAKAGQSPRGGAKALSQKSTQSKQQTAKAKHQTEIKHQSGKISPQAEKQLSEENAIIQAAEKYHQQISGKKSEKVVEKNATIAAEKRTSLPSYSQNFKTAEVQSSGAERDQNVNIYTGNPGIYQAEGDTLNFWSFTPVQVDSLAAVNAVAERPDKPYGFEGKPITAEGQDWTFLLVMVGWIIFASTRFGFSNYIVQIFQSLFNYSSSSRLYRERGYNNNFGPFSLNLIFFLFLPFSIFLIARDNGATTGFSGIEFYLIVFVVVNAYFMLKILLYKILGSVFSQREKTGELIFNMMLYHNVLGLILLPVATAHAMVPVLGLAALFIVPGLIAIFYLMSIIRSIYFAVREGISIFYLILYLCALEILPILLVVKLATGA